MACTREASALLARPITAFCSWIIEGTPIEVADRSGGTVGYPPKPTTASGFSRAISRRAVRRPIHSFQPVRSRAMGFFEPKVADGTTWISSAGNVPAKRSARLSVARWIE